MDSTVYAAFYIVAAILGFIALHLTYSLYMREYIEFIKSIKLNLSQINKVKLNTINRFLFISKYNGIFIIIVMMNILENFIFDIYKTVLQAILYGLHIGLSSRIIISIFALTTDRITLEKEKIILTDLIGVVVYRF